MCIAQADLRGQGAMPPTRPNLAPNKYQERLSGASRMQENLLAAAPDPAMELTALPRSPSWRRGAGCPFPKPHPLSTLLGLAPDPKQKTWPLPT